MAKKAAETDVQTIDWSFLDESTYKGRETKTGEPSRAEAMKAMCAGCMGGYLDGKADCLDRKCPLYHWYPYRRHEADLRWQRDGLHIAENRRKARFELKMNEVKRRRK